MVPLSATLTEEWQANGILYKATYLVLGSVLTRIPSFFFGFSTMEAYSIACGQGYQPKKEVKGQTIPENFNGVRQIYFWRVWSVQRWADVVNYWNMQIGSWLKYYVHLRAMDRS